MNRWKSYMRTAGWRIIWKKIIAVIDATFVVAKRKTEKKKSGLYGIRTLAVWDTGAALLPIELTSQLGAGLWYRWPSRPAWKIGILRYQGHCIRMSFSSYLPNRSQIVPVGTIDSDADQILRGVSQSSFLGPLFFLIYVNDIHNVPVYLISTVLQTILTFFFLQDQNLHSLELKLNEELDKVTNGST